MKIAFIHFVEHEWATDKEYEKKPKGEEKRQQQNKNAREFDCIDVILLMGDQFLFSVFNWNPHFTTW